MPVVPSSPSPATNLATLRALRALVAAGEELHRIWCTQRPDRALTEMSPEWLPDFDEFVSDLISWRDSFADAVGSSEGEAAADGAAPPRAKRAPTRPLAPHEVNLTCNRCGRTGPFLAGTARGTRCGLNGCNGSLM